MIDIRLAEVLGRKGIRSHILVKKSGIRSSTISAMWHKQAKVISFENLDKICEVLDCEVSDLLVYVRDADKPAVPDGQTALFEEPEPEPTPEPEPRTESVQEERQPTPEPEPIPEPEPPAPMQKTPEPEPRTEGVREERTVSKKTAPKTPKPRTKSVREERPAQEKQGRGGARPGAGRKKKSVDAGQS